MIRSLRETRKWFLVQNCHRAQTASRVMSSDEDRSAPNEKTTRGNKTNHINDRRIIERKKRVQIIKEAALEKTVQRRFSTGNNCGFGGLKNVHDKSTKNVSPSRTTQHGHDRKDRVSCHTSFTELKLPLLTAREYDKHRVKQRRLTLSCLNDARGEREKKLNITRQELEGGNVFPNNEADIAEKNGAGKTEENLSNGLHDSWMQGSSRNLSVNKEVSVSLDSKELDAKPKIYRLCGTVSHMRSISRKTNQTQSFDDSDGSILDNIKQEKLTDCPTSYYEIQKNSLPIADYRSKVSAFLKGTQPGPPPKSLKISKQVFEETLAQKHAPLKKAGKDFKDRTDMAIPISSIYLSPFTNKDGRPWYYTSKEGRCRYLRVPLTPVLTIEEIFKSNDNTSE